MADVFPKLRTSKKKLDQCLISPVSEGPSIGKMVNGPKDCRNLNDKTFTIFIGNCEGNSLAKSLSEGYANELSVRVTNFTSRIGA